MSRSATSLQIAASVPEARPYPEEADELRRLRALPPEELAALIEQTCQAMEQDGEIIGLPDRDGINHWYLPHQLKRGGA